MTSHTGSPENARRSGINTWRRLREFVRRHPNAILLILSILLIILAVLLGYLLLTRAFKEIFTCQNLIDNQLGSSFCDGVDFQIGPFTFDLPLIPPFTLGPFPSPALLILPRFDVIDIPLEAIRKFIAWNILLALTVISLVLAFIATHIKGFIERLLTSEGRKAILTNLSLWLLFFAILGGLFYFRIVVH